MVTHEDVTEATAATAQVLPILTVAPGDFIRDLATVVRTPFSDASDAAFNDTQLTIGDGSSANRFLAAQQVNVNGTEVYYKGFASTTPYVYLAADTVDLTVGSMTGKSLSDLDAGEVVIYLAVANMARFDALSQY